MLLNTYINQISGQMQGFFIENSIELEGNFTAFLKCKEAPEVPMCSCGCKMHIHDSYTKTIFDVPLLPGKKNKLKVPVTRYRCPHCGKKESSELNINHPGTRITKRFAIWVKFHLALNHSISSICKEYALHWTTVRKIHQEEINRELINREIEWKKTNYRPRYLAVDEFAILKGHRYATTVMDIETGEVLWVGVGRSISDFKKFFEEFNLDILSDVKAVAMDMNAAFNRVVTEYLPNAKIVYDRFHMQAQFSRDVLGKVRLRKARELRDEAKEMEKLACESKNIDEKRKLRKDAKCIKKKYKTVKRARWKIIKNSDNLSASEKATLNDILAKHEEIAVCYAMKEELCRVFYERNPELAKLRWCYWFKACKESKIPELARFAELKESRLEGLVAHAIYPINTGKLEGFNNKIKVCKRVAYGYRNLDYFFSLIRYISLPGIRN